MRAKTYTFEEGRKVEQAIKNRTFIGLLQCIRCRRWFDPHRTKMPLEPASKWGSGEYHPDELAFFCEHCLDGLAKITLESM